MSGEKSLPLACTDILAFSILIQRQVIDAPMVHVIHWDINGLDKIWLTYPLILIWSVLIFSRNIKYNKYKKKVTNNLKNEEQNGV